MSQPLERMIDAFATGRMSRRELIAGVGALVAAAAAGTGGVAHAQETAPTGTLVEVVDQVHLGGIYNITQHQSLRR